MKHRRKPSSYQKPKKKGCKHKYKANAEGKLRCIHCGDPPKPRLKSRDPKDKVRVAAHTQRRMPPPQRGH